MIRRASVLALLALATSATAADLRDRAPAQGVDPSPDFGTGIQFSAIDGFGLQPGSSSATYFRGFQSGAYYCASGTTDNRAIGQFSVPHGVQITGIRTWIKDNQATSGVMVELQRSCLPDFGPGFPITDTLTTSGTNDAFAGGDASDFSPVLGVVLVDNQSCTYKILAEVGRTNVGAISCPGAQDALGVYKVRLQWNRFIPIAPAVATFTDVPVGSQFFREVEALADTGVTAGCTATTFCPASFVTRLQMAAFLARALGLPQAMIADPANP